MTANAGAKHWWQRPLRIVQTVLREPDIQDYDAEAVIDYVSSLKANTFVVNAGGIVSFYDSKVDPHYKNRFGKGEDVLRRVIPLAHERGIKVIVRVDFRGAKQYIYERHPEWFGLHADGSPRMIAGIHAACPNSPYRWEHAFKILREVLTEWEADGIWENAAAFHGPCYCKACREKFHKDHGLEIPLKEDFSNPDFVTYREWLHQCKTEQSRAWRDVIKSCGEKLYCSEFPGPNLKNWAYSGVLDIDRQEEFFDFPLGCCFVIGRESYGSPFMQTPIWASLEMVKYFKNVSPDKSPMLLFSHLEQTSRYTSEPPRDLSLWLEGAMAAGGSLWDCTFNGQHPAATHDRRNIDLVRKQYAAHADREELIANVQEVADVAVVFSRVSQDRFGSDDPREDGYITHVRGWEQVLLENHTPFTLIPDSHLDAERLKGYKCVILANTACMTDAQAAAVRDYVHQGGSVIASFETSLYDERWRKRDDFALADTLGVHYRGVTRGPLPVSYQWLRRPHPITQAFGETDMIANNGHVCYVEVTGDAETAMTLVPEIIPQHPENAWIPELEVDNPLVVTGRYGSGRTVYIANQSDRLYLTDAHPDYATVLTESLRWALTESGDVFPSIDVQAPPSVYAQFSEEPNGIGGTKRLLISLMNVSGNPKRALSIPVPVFGIEIRLRAVKFADLKRVRRLSNGKELGVNSGNGIYIKLDTLKEFETLVFETE